ncbi:MAG: hypothetical protein E6356_00535 [Terrisporobacter othiniensis]|uniref:Uncharacterized protein n=1 Tax=Terrisporobacter hibernicus TaxID=2813371 RepID=A0AAX2ZIY9_9FIRM|nr:MULTISPECIES: hypothetical protein [Terrisporobacter]MDU4860472.1 hypothetical protein [Terrisporobacter othiniensis]MDU6993299.1 hypothetical protein [Terrisporobacter othiniensis]UEL48455.1 hypothetical protein JW646_03105 [Terrisporobacter hibernicus]SFJ34984.1 hypothetical protein SAMN02910355_2365 [Terrisporobacter glycolicus]
MNHIYVNIYTDKVKFYIVYYDQSERRQIKNDEIILPISFSMGDKLYYIKKIISTIIKQYNIESYCLEVDSDIGVDIVEAVKMEGVLEELFSSKGVMLWK